MARVNNFNQQIIDEFHTNAGKVGGFFEGKSLMLLTTTGAKSKQRHTTPVVYLSDGDRLVIFASKAGAPTHPDWYHNIVAHPQVTVEVSNGNALETFEATASVVTGSERDRLYAQQVQVMPQFAEYQEKTSRLIPVVVLERNKASE